jgi:hypothetical protein
VSRSALAVTPGSGADLLVEDEGTGKAPVHFAHAGRLIPVAAIAANSAFLVTSGTTVDLLTKKPTGATFARIMLVSDGGDVSFWDDGKDPGTDGEGMVIVAGDWYDIPNLPELANFNMLGTSATDAKVRVAWYKTS